MLTYENSVEFVKDVAAPVSVRNFFPPENGFIWSSARWSELEFSMAQPRECAHENADCILDVDVFKMGGTFEGQNVLIYLNGLRVGSYYVTDRIKLVIRVGRSILKTHNNIFTFDTPDSRKPSEFGLPDDRSLGIQLFSFQIRPVSFVSADAVQPTNE